MKTGILLLIFLYSLIAPAVPAVKYPLTCGIYNLGSSTKVQSDGELLVILLKGSHSKTLLHLKTSKNNSLKLMGEPWLTGEVKLFRQRNPYELEGELLTDAKIHSVVGNEPVQPFIIKV